MESFISFYGFPEKVQTIQSNHLICPHSDPKLMTAEDRLAESTKSTAHQLEVIVLANELRSLIRITKKRERRESQKLILTLDFWFQ